MYICNFGKSVLFSFLAFLSLSAFTFYNSVEFDTDSFDFHTVKQGTPVSHTFTLTNNTEEDIFILEAKPSCGCTVSEYTKTAIPPKGTGKVHASYDAKKVGKFNKSVRVVTSATPEGTRLYIKGEVLAQ